jgi:AcrR family transcriptional regulator
MAGGACLQARAGRAASGYASTATPGAFARGPDCPPASGHVSLATMSRDPRLGSPDRAPIGPAGSHHAGRKVIALRDPAQQASAQHGPLVRPASPADVAADHIPGSARPKGAQPAGAAPPHRPSLNGGIPAKQRGLGAQGRQTVRRLLDAGLAVFEETGLQAARVEDIVRRANTSHGTFYLYFANKDDLFRTLLQDALHDIAIITDEFPIVTSNEAGRAALRRWVRSFSDVYMTHATVFRILSQAEIVGEEVYGDGLQSLFHLAEAMTQGMTAARKVQSDENSEPSPHAELTAVACLMMLERVNYLLSAEIKMPSEEMKDRIAAIIYAAFHSS